VIVVAASVLGVALLDDARDGARARAAIAAGELCAPHLIDTEVTAVIRHARLRGDVGDDRARQALEDLAEIPLTRVAHTPLLGRIWDLRTSLAPPDAVYVALAEAFDATLLTSDRRLLRASGPTCRFEVL
jgi:predicted nucleic acid-binding protein